MDYHFIFQNTFQNCSFIFSFQEQKTPTDLSDQNFTITIAISLVNLFKLIMFLYLKPSATKLLVLIEKVLLYIDSCFSCVIKTVLPTKNSQKHLYTVIQLNVSLLVAQYLALDFCCAV